MLPLTSEGEEQEGLGDVQDIGGFAVWSASSAKPGNGIELLRDGSTETYWQSDGVQPHVINIQFQRKMQIKELRLYLDFKLDESYTPSKVSVRLGTTCQDLREVRCLELEEPSGWVSVPMHMEDDGGASSNPNTAAAGQQPCMSAYLIQLAVLSNHQNGRDTHLRQVVVLGPRPDPMRLLGHGTDFTSDEFRLFATLR